MKRMRRILGSILLGIFLISCSSVARDAQGIPTTPNPPLPSAKIAIGGTVIEAELARTEGERERGLMFRKVLPAGKGMLFCFSVDQVLTFWMKNTSLPLSIAWIGSDGVIKGMADMAPFSLAPVSSDRSVRYALEVPAGWFQAAG